MKRSGPTTACRVLVLASMVALGAPVAAQDATTKPPTGARTQMPQAVPPVETFGPLFQVTWMSAVEFTGKVTSTSHLLYDLVANNSFYSNPGAIQTFFAQIKLPAGAKLVAIQCPVFDTDPSNEVEVVYLKSRYNPVTKTGDLVVSHHFFSSGTSGYQEPTLMVPPSSQLIQYEVGNEWFLYFLRLAIGGSQQRFLGCRLIWQRTVSPASGMATFNDVPVGHPQYQFVEALAAAGITGGCGGGNYCPDAPLTRGQMAVFLSAALGLFWPF